MRVFIAIEINEEVRAAVAQVQEQLKRLGGSVKWVEPQNFHLTLKFLGEIDVGIISRLANELSAVAAEVWCFQLELYGAGVFPNERRPRVVWIGVKEGLDALFALAQKVEAVCQRLGFEPESRPFSAHVTLGRAKLPSPAPALVTGVQALAEKSYGIVQVDHLTIMGSTLTRTGSIYKPVHQIMLAV